ncbi:MAG: signal recognition particle-docking protein FtsY [bacterium]|nr:signal recognition particle-docking protein FtsY [bacterium]MDE0242752.1 signal recognition particle-docking protein FtsY [bacterium]MDE0417888.1 signal recognition particle-docking protein FtsY [bacterium]
MSQDGWLARLRAGLTRSSDRLKDSIGAIVSARKLDSAALGDLEDALIEGDIGVATAAILVAELSNRRFNRQVTDEDVRGDLAEHIAQILEPLAVPLRPDPLNRPHVVLVMGVNGTGKTTTIGKLARLHREKGLAVVLAAGDTFRAAAIEQLGIWGQRTGAIVVSGKEGGDPAALAYTAYHTAQSHDADLLLVDTAGRLHNKRHLMDELVKIRRVLGKLDADAPHDRILVVDATTGQNAHAQVETFRDACDITGLIVTKLDGSARGGVVVGLGERFQLPLHAIGVGEGADDLKPFEAREYARSLMGLS